MRARSGQRPIASKKYTGATRISDRAGDIAKSVKSSCSLRRSPGESLAAVAPQNRIEAIAQVIAARLVVGDGRAANVAPANRPNPADHRMPSLAIAEEIIRELAHHPFARFRVESAARACGEYQLQKARDRVEARISVVIRAQPTRLVQLVVLERDVLRIKLIEVPVDNRAFLGEAHLVFGPGQRRHDEERHDV